MDLTALMNNLQRDVDRISDPDFLTQLSAVEEVPPLRSLAKGTRSEDEFIVRRMRTAVLTIDLRRSVSPGFKGKAAHKTQVYMAFLRAIVAAAGQFGGQVCNVSGDRVLVLFDEKDCYRNAVQTAFLLNTVVEGVLVPSFPHRVIRCGIGIDAGRVMLSTLPVPSENGDAHPFHALVWLGKPTQRAPRLSDAANRMLSSGTGLQRLANAYYRLMEWSWRVMDEYTRLLNQLGTSTPPSATTSSNTGWHLAPGLKEKHRVEPILVSERVLKGFRLQAPDDPSLTGLWWRQRHIAIPYVHQAVFGVNAHYVLDSKSR